MTKRVCYAPDSNPTGPFFTLRPKSDEPTLWCLQQHHDQSQRQFFEADKRYVVVNPIFNKFLSEEVWGQLGFFQMPSHMQTCLSMIRYDLPEVPMSDSQKLVWKPFFMKSMEQHVKGRLFTATYRGGDPDDIYDNTQAAIKYFDEAADLYFESFEDYKSSRVDGASIKYWQLLTKALNFMDAKIDIFLANPELLRVSSYAPHVPMADTP